MELKDATVDMLGRVGQAVIDKENTILVGGAGDKEAIAERIQEIKNQIALSTSILTRKDAGTDRQAVWRCCSDPCWCCYRSRDEGKEAAD